MIQPNYVNYDWPLGHQITSMNMQALFNVTP